MFHNDDTTFLFREKTKGLDSALLPQENTVGLATLRLGKNKALKLSSVNQDFLNMIEALYHKKHKPSPKKISFSDIKWLEKDPVLQKEIASSLKSKKTENFDWEITIEGESQQYHARLHLLEKGFKSKNATVEFSLFIWDNSAQEKLAQNVKIFNSFDDLTLLPNKSYFHDTYAQKYQNQYFTGEVAVLLINILNFQRFNESYGYKIGDDIICNIATRLDECLPKEASLIRFHGDKFAILFADNKIDHIQTEAMSLAKTIHHCMTRNIQTAEVETQISLSIGIATGSPAILDSSELIQNAHIAMKRINNMSSDRTLIYNIDLQTRAHSRLKMESELRQAIKKDELLLHYQPIINLQTGNLLGFEALIRWQHPERGMVSPIEFIPLAEETGLIIPIGRWCLNEACQQMVRWTDKFPEASNLCMNVNVSSVQLSHDNFVLTAREALNNSGLSGERLKLELTETALIENADTARDILLDLKSINISLAIDDFGTGYSSLSYLNRFPADTLKIDRSFVSRLDNSEESLKIVHIISTLASTLGMNVVAEGIETQKQHELLKSLGCLYAQGYLYAKPLSKDDVEVYLKNEYYNFNQPASMIV